MCKITNNDILNLNFKVNLFDHATHKMADDNVRTPVTLSKAVAAPRALIG